MKKREKKEKIKIDYSILYRPTPIKIIFMIFLIVFEVLYFKNIFKDLGTTVFASVIFDIVIYFCIGLFENGYGLL